MHTRRPGNESPEAYVYTMSGFHDAGLLTGAVHLVDIAYAKHKQCQARSC